MTDVENQISRELQRSVPFPDVPPDWADILRRSGERSRSLRRLSLVALAVVVLIAFTATAFGGTIGRGLADFVRFSDGEPAPGPVRLDFAQLDVGAPEGMESEVIPEETRRVTSVRIDGKRHVLYVAPTRQGGFCLEWTDSSGGCWADRGVYERRGILIGGTWAAESRGGSAEVVKNVSGIVIAPGTNRVEVEYEDGTADKVRLVWVSEPIDAGFFFVSIPEEHRLPGHRPTGLVARDENGDEIAREDFFLPG